MDPSRLATRSLNPGGCIDEAGLAEGAGLGGIRSSWENRRGWECVMQDPGGWELGGSG